MSLREYQAKRNFSRTAEPAGRAAKPGRTRAPTFVVQKHAASHLHYDFRLEMEGVLKSWAVPKGFPVKRGDRRLAVEVEDHPLDYGSFEGIIPEGNYGAGTVMVWDQGTYSPLGEEPLKALQSGKLRVALQGKKLKGEWTLVRMRRFSGSKPQWLLLKSGADRPPISARADNRSATSGRSMEEIAGARHARRWESDRPASRSRLSLPARTTRVGLPAAGGTPSLSTHQRHGARPQVPGRRASARGRDTVELGGDLRLDLARLPARAPRFTEPMKALLVAALPKGTDWIYEIKFDGVRALAIKNGQSLRLLSRSANDLANRYPEVLEALKALPAKEAILDGEVVAVDAQGRAAFQLLQTYQSAGRAKPPLFYYVFDAIQFEGKDLTGVPLWQRKELARRLVENLGATVRFSAGIQADSRRVMKEMRARGLEGLVAKRKESAYESGRRSGAWAKFKWTNEQEFVIGGFTRPKGARSHFGALLVGYYEKGHLLFAAKVGTGFSEQTLESLREKFGKLVRTQCPFENVPQKAGGLSAAEMRRCTWLRPELVCQIRFAEWTRDHHLRQPAFLGLREDKAPREVVRERPH